jgi:hypothetical protein
MMFIEPSSELWSLGEPIVEDAASGLTPHVEARYDATTSSIRRIIGQLKAVGISMPKVERLAWGFYWSSEEAGKPLTFRQGHVEVEVQQAPGILPKLTVHEWLFDLDRRTTREITVLA